jgi:O-acetyl-ADP-ribose deacetylase (regulator of RNase III)
MQVRLHNILVEIITGDLTDLKVDAIVNAANTRLQLGTGVSGVILLKGGPKIQEECDLIQFCEVGSAVITWAGDLPARYVIHAVGPRLGEGQEKQRLASATRAAINLAEINRLQSLAFPALSTGVFGYPMEAAARVILEEIIVATFDEDIHHIKRIIVCLYDEHGYGIFATELESRLRELPQ